MSDTQKKRIGLLYGAVLFIVFLAIIVVWFLSRTQSSPETVATPTTANTAISPQATDTAAATLVPPPTETPILPATEPPPTETLPPPATETAVPTPTATFITHTIQEGDTLEALSQRYNVSVKAIADASNITPLTILQIGDVLNIPVDAQLTTNEPTAESISGGEVEPTADITDLLPDPPPSNWPPSLIGADVAANYPLTQTSPSGQIIIHYQPDTYPAQNIIPLIQAIDASWQDIQTQVGKTFPGTIDVYLAGTFFAVNPALQGRSQSWDKRTFVMVNGAFHPGEEDYIIAHELTHIASMNLLGGAYSTMIHEGMGVHVPQDYLTQKAGYLPHTEICAALIGTPEFKTAVQLHDFTYGPREFGGHIRTFFNYNLSGCFVTYLLETYGLEQFDALYETGNYEGIYGRSLTQVDQDWQAWLTAVPVTVDANQLIQSVNNVAAAYDQYVAASAGGVHANWEAYQHLNRARLATNQGQFAQSEAELAQFYSLFTTRP